MTYQDMLKDNSLSFGARGLMLWILAQPSDVAMQQIADRAGKEKADEYLSELVSGGYLSEQ